MESGSILYVWPLTAFKPLALPFPFVRPIWHANKKAQ